KRITLFQISIEIRGAFFDFHRLIDDHHCVFEVVESRGRKRLGQRQKILPARKRFAAFGMCESSTQIAPEPVVLKEALSCLCPLHEFLATNRQFAHRNDDGLGCPADGSLAVRIKLADRLDGITEELDPMWRIVSRRKDVEYAATQAEFADR